MTFKSTTLSTMAAGVIVQFAENLEVPASFKVAGHDFSVGERMGGKAGLRQVNVPKGMDVNAAVEQLKGRNDVVFAELDYRVSLSATPNDPSFSSLWGLNNTGQSGGTIDADIDAPGRRGKLRPEAPQPLSLLLILVWITTMSILQATYGSIRAKLPAMALMMMAMASLMIFTVTISLTMMRIQSPDSFSSEKHGTHVAGTIGAMGDQRNRCRWCQLGRSKSCLFAS